MCFVTALRTTPEGSTIAVITHKADDFTRLIANAPFAFPATCTARLSARGKAQHQPLSQSQSQSQSLEEFSSSCSRAQLLSLLLPVRHAAKHCEWRRNRVQAGELCHPLRWTAA
ncbi:hypothetical protein [Polaromonas sp. CG9_12]|nr:hypothetical protein [Polaromonas sp. CG9_12]